MKLITLLIFLFSSLSAFSQQSINKLTTKELTVNGFINVNSTSNSSKPCPAMDELSRDTILLPLQGSCIYNTDTLSLNVYNGSTWKAAGGGVNKWTTSTNYQIDDVVIQSNKFYIALTNHTSGTFSTDLASGYWLQVQPLGPTSSVNNEVALWDGTGGDKLKRATGTGFAKLTSGVLSTSSTVNMASEVTGVLAMANGGSDKALTPTLGGVVYTDANSMEVLAAGTSGQYLGSNGAAAPTWKNLTIGMQTRSGSIVNPEVIEVADSKLTNLGSNHRLIEPSDDNLLVNANYEDITDYQGHTTSGPDCTFSIESTSGLITEGKKSGKFFCNGAYKGVVEQSVNHAGTPLTGLPGIVKIIAATVTRGVHFCALIDTVETDCIDVIPDGKSHTYKIPIIFGATSVGYRIYKDAFYSDTQVVRFDKAYVGYADTIDAAPVVTKWKSYTPSFSGLGTPTDIECKCRRNGSNQDIQCKFTAGTTTATELRIGLCDNATVSNADVPTITTALGRGTRNNAGNANNDFAILMDPGKSYLNFSYINVNGASSLAPQQGNNIITTSDRVMFNTSIPVNEYTPSVPVYYDRCENPLNCETTLSAYVDTSGGNVENVDWISGNCSWPSTGKVRCTLNSGVATQELSCNINVRDNTAGVIQAQTMIFHSLGGGYVEADIYNGGSRMTDNVYINCHRMGVDYTSAKIRMIVGAFQNYAKMKVPSGKARSISFRFGGNSTCTTACTTGTCNVCNPLGDFTTVTHAGSNGLYRINNITGTNYNCTGSGYAPGVSITGLLDNGVGTSSYKQVGFVNVSGGDTNSYGSIHCDGYEP